MNFLNKLNEYYKYSIPVIIFFVYIQIFNFNLTEYYDDQIINYTYNEITQNSNYIDFLLQPIKFNSEFSPVTSLSYLANVLVSGQNSYSFHLLNLIILILTGIYFYRILDTFNTNKILIYCLSIFFSIHPLIGSNVGWIPGRSILLINLFGVLGFYQFSKFLKENLTYNLLLSSIFLLIALLSDKTALIYFPVIIIYGFIFHKERMKFNISSISGLYFLALICYLTFDVYIMSNYVNKIQMVGYSVNTINLGIFYLDFSKITSIPEYLGAFILSIKMDDTNIVNMIRNIIGSVILILMVVVTIIKRNSKNVIFGMILIIIFALCQIITFDSKIGILFNHYNPFYLLPFLGMCFFLLELLKNSFSESKVNSVLFVILLAFFSFQNYYYLRNFSSNNKFYEFVNNQHPNNPEILNKLIEIKVNSGDIITAEKLVNGIKYKNKLNSRAFITLGDYYYSIFDYNKSVKYLGEAVRLDSGNINAINLLSNSYYKIKDYEKSTELLYPLTNQSNKFPEAKWDLMNLLIESKNFDDATVFIKNKFVDENDKVRVLQLIDSWSKIFFKEPDNVAVVKVMKLGLEIDPNNAVILNYLFDTYTKVGMKSKAVEYEKRLKTIFNEEVLGNGK